MDSYSTVLNALAEKSGKITIDGLTKIIKPIDSVTFSGEFSPLILPSLAKFQQPRPLENNLEKLRAGNEVSGTVDLVGNQVLVALETIEYLNRRVPVEILTPQNLKTEHVLLYFHGGSFYGGDLADVHDFLKAVAKNSGRQIISVDYALAPEEPYPAGILDGLAVLRYYQQELGRKVALAGDSAGGNIALGVARLCYELGYEELEAQILLYPVVTLDHSDPTLWNTAAYPIRSEQNTIRDHLLKRTIDLTAIMKEYYLRHGEQRDAPLIAPLAVKDVSYMPRTLQIIGEYDFFRLANEAFAHKLVTADVPLRFLQYSGMVHAFAPLIGLLPQAEDVVNEISIFLRS